MSRTDDAETAAGEPARTCAARNRTAELSAFFAPAGVAFPADLATGIALITRASSPAWPCCAP